MTESEVDEATEEQLQEMLREEAWEAATDPEQGYEGVRGVTPRGAARTPPPLRNPDAPEPEPELEIEWRGGFLLRHYALTITTPPPSAQ